MEISRITAAINVLPVYKCHKCGKRRNGTMQHLQFDEQSIEAVFESLKKARLRSAYMPLGWSYNNDYNFYCEEHINGSE